MEKLLNFGKRNIHLLVAGILALIGIIVGAFVDFKVSEALYSPSDPGNAFTIIVAGFAEFPCYLFCTFGGIGLIVSMPKDQKWKKILCWIIGILAIGISTGLGAKTCAEYLVKFDAVKDFAKILQICGVIFVILCAAAVILVVVLKRNSFDKVKLFKVSIYMICAAAAFVLFSNLVKYIVCRPRPLLVFASENPSDVFRSWFIMKPLDAFKHGADKDLYLSFPSGHTGAGMTLAGCLPVLFSLFKTTNTRKFEVIGTYTGVLFMLLCALGRIMCGAHFLADVSMGALLVIIETIALREVLPIIFRKAGVKDE